MSQISQPSVSLLLSIICLRPSHNFLFLNNQTCCLDTFVTKACFYRFFLHQTQSKRDGNVREKAWQTLFTLSPVLDVPVRLQWLALVGAWLWWLRWTMLAEFVKQLWNYLFMVSLQSKQMLICIPLNQAAAMLKLSGLSDPQRYLSHRHTHTHRDSLLL